MAKNERLRVIRVIVYEGEADWVRQCIKDRGVKETMSCFRGTIKEGFIGGQVGDIVFSDPALVMGEQPPDEPVESIAQVRGNLRQAQLVMEHERWHWSGEASTPEKRDAYYAVSKALAYLKGGNHGQS